MRLGAQALQAHHAQPPHYPTPQRPVWVRVRDDQRAVAYPPLLTDPVLPHCRGGPIWPGVVCYLGAVWSYETHVSSIG